MPRKNVLVPFQTITNGDMSAASITSLVSEIQYLDDIAIQMNWSGSPVGTFAIQGSLDYAQDYAGNVTNAGNWIALTLNPIPAATGSSGNWLVNLDGLSFPAIRLVYTKTSGTGTLNAFISGKEI